MTWGVCSITARATLIGCLMRSSAATLPQLNWWSMMQASSVTVPSRSGLPPRPTQQFWEASVTRTPASTASRAAPLRLRICQAAWLAATPSFQVEMARGRLGAPGRGGRAAVAATGRAASRASPAAEEVRNFRRLVIASAFGERTEVLGSSPGMSSGFTEHFLQHYAEPAYFVVTTPVSHA